MVRFLTGQADRPWESSQPMRPGMACRRPLDPSEISGDGKFKCPARQRFAYQLIQPLFAIRPHVIWQRPACEPSLT